MDKRLIGLAAVLLVMLAPVSAQASGGAVQMTPRVGTIDSATPFTVDARSGDQTDPHTYGGMVSYTNEMNGGSAVDVYDIASGTNAEVPTSGAEDFLSDIGSAGVFFTHLTTESAIGHYDPATGTTTEIAPTSPSNRSEARTGGSTLVWQDFDYTGNTSDPELVVYDLATGTATRLTNDLLLDKDAAVSPDGNTIVWTKCQQDSTGCAIWEAQRTSGGWTSAAITDPSDGQAALPDTDGNVVVYSMVSNGDEDVYWQPVGGGVAHEIALPGQQTNPNVSNGVITFEQLDRTTEVPNYDVYAYDIATNTEYRLTSSPEDETLNDVYASGRDVTVVWAKQEYDENVYGESFTLPAIPSSLSLSAVAGTSPSVTAAAGIAGDSVQFTLTGAVNTTGSCTTGADGTCTFPFAAPSADGTVDVDAFVDTNLDGVADNAEPTASTSVAFLADSTPPTVSVDGFADGQQFVLGTAPTVTCSSSDAGSGVASTTGPVEQANLTADGVGTVTYTCGATDYAGNSASDTKTYRVVYAATSFLAPVQAVNAGHAGRAYPLKWQLTDTNGAFISALTAVTSIRYQAVSCSAFQGTAAAVDADTTGNSGLRYDAATQTYVYTWATPKTAGCYVVSVTLDSGQVLQADFQLS